METNRKPRPLDVSGDVRRALAALRQLDGVDNGDAGLDLGRVLAVEHDLGCHLPDDVLAILAAKSDQLTEHGADLAVLVPNTRAARKRGWSRNYVAIGRQPDGHAYYCIDATDRGSTTIYDCDNLNGNTVTPQPLAGWLNEFVERQRDFLMEGTLEQRKRAEASKTPRAESFCPRLMNAEPAQQRVAHAKFGKGTVVGETGSGELRKLQIDFDAVGKKWLLARFVEEVPGDGRG